MNINDPHNSRELAKLMTEVKAHREKRWEQFMNDARKLPNIETMRRKWQKIHPRWQY